MFLPRHRAAVHVPNWLVTLTLAVTAMVLTLLAWAAFAARPTSDGVQAVLPALPESPIRSVAYWVSEGGRDVIYARDVDSGEKRFITSFQPIQPAAGLHIRGKASPGAGQIAVLSVSQPNPTAQLTFVDVATGEKRPAQGAFDQLSELAWSRDGLSVAAVRPDHQTVVVIDSKTLNEAEIARFAGARSVAPVGYSLNGRRLFVVVLDQSGSTLWAVEGNDKTRLANLSEGLTTSWTLSPDGSRMAYIDVIGVGEQRYAGRTLLIGAGQVLSASPTGDQVGAAWRPGREFAEFGGPGGSFELFGVPQATGSYVVPLAWSPDGTWLVTAIYSGGESGNGSARPSIELARPGEPIRVPVVEEGSGPATFLGWVHNED